MRYIVLTLLSFWLLAGCGSEPTTQEGDRTHGCEDDRRAGYSGCIPGD